MLNETILVPHPLAEDCYLGEALMWVAINRFPLDPLNEEAWDIRLELDEIVGLEPNVEVEGPERVNDFETPFVMRLASKRV